MNILLLAPAARSRLLPLLTEADHVVQEDDGNANADSLATADLALVEAAVFPLPTGLSLAAFLEQCRSASIACLLIGADPSVITPARGLYPLPSIPDDLLLPVLGVIGDQVKARREARVKADRLHRLEATLVEERRVARYALEQFISHDQLIDPALHFWSRAAHSFSGDIILAARTPANALHLMLIDNMSRGTGAMVSALPVIAPFYRMTEKGFSIDAIVREANARIFRLSPDGRSVPATLVSVDFSDGVVHVWNGGTPKPILLNPLSGSVQTAQPRAELGSFSPESFNVLADIWTFQEECLLALGTRGLMWHIGGDGGDPSENIAHWLHQHDGGRFDRLKQLDMLDFPDIVSGNESVEGEDMSLILVKCQRDVKTAQSPAAKTVSLTSGGEWQLSLRISPDEMRSVDIVPLLLGVIGQFSTTQAMTGTLFVVLSELYNNALDHGILGLDSALKKGPDGMGAFLDERSRRLEALQKGEIELALSQAITPDGLELSVICTDSGPGFNHADVCRRVPVDTEVLPYGRGLALIKSLASSIEFNPQGNRLHIRLPIAPNGD